MSAQEIIVELAALTPLERREIARRIFEMEGNAPAAANGNNPALQVKDGLLVFTGKIAAPETDWLQVVRDERDEELIRRAIGDDAAR